ncbi:flavin reductase family protein [Streptomyces olindensis]|uniref:flavin reductase family protein n=1 Tax=Streptomyces olindensis TaxID=358823 RepID=UPI003660CFF9
MAGCGPGPRTPSARRRHRPGGGPERVGEVASAHLHYGRLARRRGHRHGEASAGGGVYIHGAGLWLDCSVHAELPGGDHIIVLLEIHGLRAEPDREPLVFHGSRFRRLAV